MLKVILLSVFSNTSSVARDEVEDWCRKHRTHSLSSLTPVYKKLPQLIVISPRPCITSTTTQEKRCMFYQFSDEMTAIMNDQWTSGTKTQGNISKDKGTMIRYICSIIKMYIVYV